MRQRGHEQTAAGCWDGLCLFGRLPAMRRAALYCVWLQLAACTHTSAAEPAPLPPKPAAPVNGTAPALRGGASSVGTAPAARQAAATPTAAPRSGARGTRFYDLAAFA